MKYRAEIVRGGMVVAAQNYTNATHPNQVVRRIVEVNRHKIDYADVYVMNERGERWVYSLERTRNEKFNVRPVKIINDPLPKDMVISAFAGNTQIRKLK